MASDLSQTAAVGGVQGADGDGERVRVPEKPPSLAEHVRRVLRQEILSGRLAPGQHLPEHLVARLTGVSRTPIREAMRVLQSEGLVVSKRGQGTYVEYRLSREEALLTYGCRLLIEPHMASLAAQRMGARELREVHDILRRFREAIDRDDAARTLSSIDAEFHDAICSASKSGLLAVFRSYWAKLQFDLSTRVYSRESPEHFYREHMEILAALEAGDGEAAARTMREHIAHGQRLIEESFAAEGTAGGG